MWLAYTNMHTPYLAYFQQKYQWYSHYGKKSSLVKVDVKVNVQTEA